MCQLQFVAEAEPEASDLLTKAVEQPIKSEELSAADPPCRKLLEMIQRLDSLDTVVGFN